MERRRGASGEKTNREEERERTPIELAREKKEKFDIFEPVAHNKTLVDRQSTSAIHTLRNSRRNEQ